ncbi:MAG: HDIG domain-containing protein [Candidatus Bathyarchaeota archaeon]|nr:HDIG domain-containing protein [Candidatus Bathyarchaeota archaeon]
MRFETGGVTRMMTELESLASEIGDEGLRGMVLDFLKRPKAELKGGRLPLDECPGGAYVHHAYEGGLLQHTVAVVRLVLTICDLVEGVYGGEVDRDVVMAGALLHDLMKCYSYTREGDGFRTSPLGERVDHLSLLVAELYRRGFPVDVIHAVAAHHGDQSPVKPKTLEALILSVADLADSELSRQTMRAAEYLVREATGRRWRFGSSEEVLEVLRIKAREGWEGLRHFDSNGETS